MEGGLGFKSMQVWNMVAIAKHIWFLISVGEQSMWCQWVKSYLIKGKNFWNLKIPGSTWVCRKLLNLRPLVQPYFLNVLGDGQSTSLWYDNWHPLGLLIVKFSPKIAFDSGISKDATVSHILQNSICFFPITQTLELNEVRGTLPPLIPSRLEEADHIRWTLTPNGQFSIASLRDKSRTPFPTTRLSTVDRLVLFSMNLSPQCSFCQGSESHDHLFFNCAFSQQVWNTMLSKIRVSWHSRTWPKWVTFLSSLKGKSFQTVIAKLVFTTTVYHFWIERNMRKFQGISPS
ncbi:uncharacterized protein LOC131309495 [Rhododendron vialii]|uniref:uncharacterized protein LOC131309495 n=1 Tax=Rhododendron vialii TaxID=182163 RepID=UPI0026601F08|nr:uncharacterized protein LOC131309495 [Rhododendron vialii]